MICIIAGNYQEARNWAFGQQLEPKEWFYPEEPSILYQHTNFHTIVIGNGGQNVPASYFEKLFLLAKTRGRIDRK